MQNNRLHRGFSLMEIVVVLAVIGLLAGALMPMVLGYLEDAKRSKADAEVRATAAALASLTKDLRHFPAYTGENNSGPAEIELLCSAGSLPGLGKDNNGNDIGDWPSFNPGDNCAAADKVDTLENILVRNTPVAGDPFNTTKRDKGQWKGPYGERFNMADPWERAYVVNIKNGAVPGNLDKVIWVLSAGPDGLIDTPSNSLRTAGDLVPGNDDIAVRIK